MLEYINIFFTKAYINIYICCSINNLNLVSTESLLLGQVPNNQLHCHSQLVVYMTLEQDTNLYSLGPSLVLLEKPN